MTAKERIELIKGHEARAEAFNIVLNSFLNYAALRDRRQLARVVLK